MRTHHALWVIAVVLSACSGRVDPPPPPPVVASPVAPPAPSVDLSGQWECSFGGRGFRGSETWTVTQQGTSLDVLLSGRDPGGRYGGTMTGQVLGSQVQLAYSFHDGTRGTMALVVAENATLLDGESRRANPDALPAHYSCSRR
jgi:hypothetical protein